MTFHSDSAKFLPEGIFGNFFPMKASSNDMWQFFNSTKRRWDFLKVHKTKTFLDSPSIILRNGWLVRKLHRGRAPLLYSVKDDKLIQTNISETEKKISEFDQDLVELKANVDDENFLTINLSDVHFTNKEYQEMTNLNGAVSMDGVLYLPMPSLDSLRQILVNAKVDLKIENNIQIKLTEESEQIQSKISKLLQILYSKYLKKESKIEELQIALLTKSLDSIQDEDVRESLMFITKDHLDNTEKILYDFLSEKVVTYFDWKLLADFSIDHYVEGLTLSGTSKDYLGKWSTNYFKIILPNFESVVHLQTRISPTFRGIGEIDPLKVRLSKIQIEKWRYYPYLGKLKNTGNRDEIAFDYADIPFINSSLRSIIGIPTVEKILREMCFLDSFSLDLEEWHGSYNLSRYFLACVKVIKPLDESAKIPCLLVEDFFGNQFKIAWEFKTYQHYSADIHGISKGGYISVVIKNKFDNSLNERDEIDFETLFGVSFRFVTRKDFFTKNVLSLIKYVGHTNIEILKQVLKNTMVPNIEEILQELEKSHEIHIRNNMCYYCYNSLTAEQLSSLLDLMDNPESLPQETLFSEKWYVAWSLIRENLPTIHPLSYSININTKDNVPTISTLDQILQLIAATKESHHKQITERAQKRTDYLLHMQKNSTFQETLVGEKDPEMYIRHARYMFKNFGQASLKARGRRIPKAHYIAKYLARQFSYIEPRIVRKDNVTKDPIGRPVREVEFSLESYKLEV